MSDLKPCPFCGRAAEIYFSKVSCSNSGCSAALADFAVEEWNARAPDTTLIAEIKKEVEFTCDTSSPFSSDPPQHIKNRLLTFLDRIGGGK